MSMNIVKPFTGTTVNAVASAYVTPEELAAFVAALAAKYGEHQAETFKDERLRQIIMHDGGTKYARIVTRRLDIEGGSAFCFIDLSNGNILKPASWKAANTKHARGNIRVGDASNWWNSALGPYGAAYLR